MEITCENLSLDELASIENFSVRAKNVCRSAGLDSLHEFLEFYLKHRTFNNIWSCGRLTNGQLIAVCKKYFDQELDEDGTVELDGKNYKAILDSFSPTQKAILVKHFESLRLNLSIRALNGLSAISPRLDFDEISKSVFLVNFDFMDIPKIGHKTSLELRMLKQEIIRFIKEIESDGEGLFIKRYKMEMLQRNFRNLPADFETMLESLCNENGEINLFKLIEYLIGTNQMFNKSYQKVFEVYFRNNDKTLVYTKLIAEHLNITRVRVKLLIKRLEVEIKENLLFISNVLSYDLDNSGLSTTEPLLFIDDRFANSMNEKAGVNFNSIFYSFVISILFKETHTSMNAHDIFHWNKKIHFEPRNSTGCYLIANRLFEHFEFKKCLSDVYSRIHQKNNKTYSYLFQSYIRNFVKAGGEAMLDELNQVCSTIINSELALSVDPHGRIIFERNTPKKLFEYCIDILEQSSKPMTLIEIEKALREKYHIQKKTTLSSIRSNIIQKRDIFISFGRTSTYALKKWETKKKNMKGGSIRNMVEEYLLAQNSPKNLSCIMEFVLRYRPTTNKDSVLTSLKVDRSNRFRFFKDQIVGLNSKNYDTSTLEGLEESQHWIRKSDGS